jgi:hypothetical protein
MADIDYTTSTVNNSFQISLTDNPTQASGNKLLSNRFSITFLTNTKTFLLNDIPTNDNYGGNAGIYIGQPSALTNTQSIATSITGAMNKTVDSIKSNQSNITDPTEQLDSAKLINISVVEDTIYAVIQIFPVAYSSSNELYFTIPVITI